jgi:hypothetical protein
MPAPTLRPVNGVLLLVVTLRLSREARVGRGATSRHEARALSAAPVVEP